MERARKKTIQADGEPRLVTENAALETLKAPAAKRRGTAAKLKPVEDKISEAVAALEETTDPAAPPSPATPAKGRAKAVAPKASTPKVPNPKTSAAKTSTAKTSGTKTSGTKTTASKAAASASTKASASKAPAAKVSKTSVAKTSAAKTPVKASASKTPAATKSKADKTPVLKQTAPKTASVKARVTKDVAPKPVSKRVVTKPAVSRPGVTKIEPLDFDAEIKLGFLADFVGFHLRLAQDASYRAFSRHRDKDLIKPGRLPALAIIHLNPGISQSALGRAIARDKSTVSPLIKDLQKNGFINRKASTQDRRSVTLALTKKGERTLERLQARAQEHENEIDRIIGPSKGRLLSMLDKITTGMAA